VFGGTAPLVATALVRDLQSPVAPALVVIVCAVLTFAGRFWTAPASGQSGWHPVKRAGSLRSALTHAPNCVTISGSGSRRLCSARHLVASGRWTRTGFDLPNLLFSQFSVATPVRDGSRAGPRRISYYRPIKGEIGTGKATSSRLRAVPRIVPVATELGTISANASQLERVTEGIAALEFTSLSSISAEQLPQAAKPPSPVQIRTAPPPFLGKIRDWGTARMPA
jgi:hypothetical protein